MGIDIAGQTIIDLPVELASQIGGLVKVFQAVGGVIIIYLIFNIINSLFNRKKQKEFESMNNQLKEIKSLLKNNIVKKNKKSKK